MNVCESKSLAATAAAIVCVACAECGCWFAVAAPQLWLLFKLVRDTLLLVEPSVADVGCGVVVVVDEIAVADGVVIVCRKLCGSTVSKLVSRNTFGSVNVLNVIELGNISNVDVDTADVSDDAADVVTIELMLVGVSAAAVVMLS